MEKKVKLIKLETTALRSLSVQIVPEIYDKLNKISQNLNLTKRVLISTAIVKLLDEIEVLGIEL